MSARTLSVTCRWSGGARRGRNGQREIPLGNACRRGTTHKRVIRRGEDGRSLLCGALQRDDGQMVARAEIADVEIEPGPRLTSNESLGRGAKRAPGPARARLEARRPDGGMEMTANLVGGRGAEVRMWTVAVVPNDVQGQLLLNGGETLGNHNQPPCSLVLDDGPRVRADLRLGSQTSSISNRRAGG